MSNSLDREAMPVREPRPSARKGLLFLLVLIAIGAVFAVFVIDQRSVDGPLVETEAPVALPVNVEVVRLLDRFEIEERFTGLVTPKRTSQLGFSSGGRIERLNADTGDMVAAGAVLARLDTRGLNAQLAAALAQVNEAEASYKLALATVERQVTLQGQGHVSIQRVDEAVAQSNTGLARIEAARANADTLRVQIDLARIEAPYAGMITARMSDEGAIAAPGQPVFELVEVASLEVRIGLLADLADTLELGATYTLLAGETAFDARLRAVTGVIDPQQRTVGTVFDILEPSKVAPGAVARIALKRSMNERGLWVPVSALTETQQGLWSVYLARRSDDGWSAQPGMVEVVHTDGERVFVRGAVRDGDLLIREGLQRITPGQPVKPTQVGQTAKAPDHG